MLPKLLLGPNGYGASRGRDSESRPYGALRWIGIVAALLALATAACTTGQVSESTQHATGTSSSEIATTSPQLEVDPLPPTVSELQSTVAIEEATAPITFRIPEVADTSDLAQPDDELLRLPLGSDGLAVAYDRSWGPCCFAADSGIFAVVDINNGRLLVINGDAVAEASLPFSPVLGIDMSEGAITLIGTRQRPGQQNIQLAQVDLNGELLRPVLQREDLIVFADRSSRDRDGTLWINVSDLTPGESTGTWAEAFGGGAQPDMPLPDETSLSIRFSDRGAAATMTRFDSAGTAVTTWELESSAPLSLAEVAPDGGDILLVVTHTSEATSSGLVHRLIRLTPTGTSILASFEAVTTPYIEIGGTFEWDRQSQRLIRFLPDELGVSIVAYNILG